MRDEMMRRLATYGQMAEQLKDGNPIKILILDAMESVRRDLARLDARQADGIMAMPRPRGRPPQKPRQDAR